MHQRFSAITIFVLTVLPGVVSAQEHETALSPFAGNVGNALWTVVIFVLVVLVLGKFAWGPILDQLKTRENFIHDALSAAKQQKEAAEASLKDTPKSFGRRASRPIRSSRRAALTPNGCAKRCVRRQRARPRQSCRTPNADSLETGRALQQIRHEAADLSVMIASKLIQRNLSKEDNEKLIEDALRQVETRRH